MLFSKKGIIRQRPKFFLLFESSLYGAEQELNKKRETEQKIWSEILGLVTYGLLFYPWNVSPACPTIINNSVLMLLIVESPPAIDILWPSDTCRLGSWSTRPIDSTSRQIVALNPRRSFKGCLVSQ